MNKSKEIVRAERLRVVVDTEEWRDTVGAWIQELQQDAIRKVMGEEGRSPEVINEGRGAHQALQEILDRIADTFSKEDAAVKRFHKTLTQE